LLDNNEIGGGMCLAAGLQELAKIQNKILKQLVTLYSQKKNINPENFIDTFEYPPQKMKENHILSFNIDEMIRLCSLSSLNYQEGEQLVYDFGRIEGIIMKELIHKKLMDEEKFEFVLYQLEIFKIGRFNYITEIRAKIP
jgi:hypothetical protein